MKKGPSGNFKALLSSLFTLHDRLLPYSVAGENVLYPGGIKGCLSVEGWERIKIFDDLECLAAMCSHVPDKGEQMVRYYGHYSNVSRGKRKIQDQDELIPSILDSGGSSKERRKNWARLIQKIYETDPLCCPKCSGAMKVISVIEDQEVIKKILKHLGLWDIKARPPPRKQIRVNEIFIDYSHRGVGPYGPEAESQLLTSDDYLYADPEPAFV